MCLAAWVMEDKWVYDLTLPVMGSLFFQSVVIAFASYLLWFQLIHNYPVAKLSAFTFLTPLFGVMSGVLFLGESLTPFLVGGLILVSIGIYLANQKK
jgi:drug/metabolite transporter (DMT)-like permease